MDEEIAKNNELYMKNWISLNPNLKDITFSNNTLYTPDEKINFKNFLVSELLKNNYFYNNKYTLSEKDFIFILKLHVTANDILNDFNTSFANENIGNEYIKNIKLALNYSIEVTTNNQTYRIYSNHYSKILMLYKDLLTKYNDYIPASVFFEELKKFNIDVPYKKIEKNNLNFLDILHKDSNYSSKEINHLEYISKFIFTLLCNEEYICSSAKDLLDIYNYEMNKLSNKTTLSANENFILSLYKKNVSAIEDLERKKEEKEASLKKASSFGFSSLLLIVSSVLFSGFFLALYLIFK